jgi:hypothetical protein
MYRNIIALITLLILSVFRVDALDHPGATLPVKSAERFNLVSEGIPLSLLVSESDNPAVLHAARNLQEDFLRVTGVKPAMGSQAGAGTALIIGTLDSPLIKEIAGRGKIDVGQLAGCT